MTSIRTLSYLLHPPFLDEAGLVSALRWYVEGFSRRSGITVSLDLPEGFPRLSRDVETTLFRVVQEALINIHRHADSRDALIRLQRDGSRVILEVEDHGRGLSVESLAQLPAGNGALGRRRGRHARTVAAARRRPRDRVGRSRDTGARPRNGRRSGIVNAGPLRLVVVDDHGVVRRGVRALLESRPGWEVVGGGRQWPRSGGTRAVRFHPDVIILDLSMPDMNGLEATRRILEESPQTEVLVLTMHHSEQLAREVLQAGARGYLLNPTPIRTHCGGRQPESAQAVPDLHRDRVRAGRLHAVDRQAEEDKARRW